MPRGKKSKATKKKAAPKREKPTPPIAASSPAPPEPKPEPAPPAVTVPSNPPPGIAGLPSPPDDELASAAWSYRLLIASLDDIRTDPDLSPRERRKEIRVQTAAAAKLMPRARLYEAEKLVREHHSALREKAKEKRTAVLVPRPKARPAKADVPSP